MGDDKKKPSGGRKGGMLKKVLLLAVLVLVGAEVFARTMSQYEWSPYTRVMNLIKNR
jgi:hypothetical protein